MAHQRCLCLLLSLGLLKSDHIIAQTLPKELRSLTDQNTTNGSVLVIEKLSPEQRKFYWQNTTRHPLGYLENSSTIEYLNVVDEMANLAVKMTNPALLKDYKLTVPATLGTHSIRVLQEDSHRINFVFTHPKRPSHALTIWNFKNAGAKITLVREFFNCKVNGVNAVLALAKNKSTTKVVWKLSWWTKGIDYEFYVNDNLKDATHPMLSPQEVIALASSLSAEKPTSPANNTLQSPAIR